MDKDKLVASVITVVASIVFFFAGFATKHYFNSNIDVKAAVCGQPQPTTPPVTPTTTK